MIKKDEKVLGRIKTDSNKLALDARIWSFPKFNPTGSISAITDAINKFSTAQHHNQQQSYFFQGQDHDGELERFASQLPDP